MKSTLPERYMLQELRSKQEKHLPKAEYTAWERNVRKELRHLSDNAVREKVAQNRLPFAFLMVNLTIDYNLGAVVRLANAMGGEVYYYGSKRYDKRGAVGTYHYTPVNYLATIEDVKNLKKTFQFVALEQTKTSTPISKFQWSKEKNTLILLGEEACGLDAYQEIMSLVDYCVEIPMRGSVPSLNVATSAAIAAYDYSIKW